LEEKMRMRIKELNKRGVELVRWRRIKELNKRGVEAVGVCVYLSKDVERQIYRGYGDGEYKTVVNELKKLRSQEIDVQEEEPQMLEVSPLIDIPGPLVVAGISALSAVIGSLLSYLATSKSGEIVITGSSGRNITIPKDTPKEDIDFYINKAKEIDGDIVEVYTE
jgi:hypothetical protein